MGLRTQFCVFYSPLSFKCISLVAYVRANATELALSGPSFNVV